MEGTLTLHDGATLRPTLVGVAMFEAEQIDDPRLQIEITVA
jgi:hypothetical protein